MGARIVRDELAVPVEDRVTFVLSSETSSGEDDAEMMILPEKPPWLASEIIELAVAPSASVVELGLADTVKSDAINGTT